MLHEENFFASFYNNQIVFESLGKELCISLDVALAGSGCEAVVEGFYSVVAAHKKNGGQGNTVLIERAVVDWCIPDPITCPETMKKIAQLYTEGDKKIGIARHRSAELFDEHSRAREKQSQQSGRQAHYRETQMPSCHPSRHLIAIVHVSLKVIDAN